MSTPDPTTPVQPSPARPTAFIGSTAAGPVDTVVRVTSAQDYLDTFAPSGPESLLDHAVTLFFANGGADALVVRAAGGTADHLVPAGGPGGLNALTERFSVLVVPGLTARHTRAVEQALARCASERAVLLLDLPSDADARSAVLAADRVRGARDRAAAYHPWVVVGPTAGPDSGPGGVAVPPSGAVAGVVASTAASRGLGQTPLGGEEELHGVDGLATSLDARDSELLSTHGVNALRDLPDRRRVVWGGRLLAATEATEPSSRYLAVRRLTDHVLESLEEGMAFVAGRRADPGVATLVRRRSEDFLTQVWREGALAGTTPDEAFFARCDRSTTTDADLAAGRLVLQVGLATTRPAEFEVHTVVLETEAATGPRVLDPTSALARATSLARERRTVVRRANLAALTSRYLAEAEKGMSALFEQAAQADTVLLLEDADAVLGRSTDGRGRQRATELARLLDQLSHRTGVPYVLAARR